MWTLHTVLGDQVSANPEDDVIVTLKPRALNTDLALLTPDVL